MREPKPEWVAQLRALEGCGEANIRWNRTVGRWEFVLPSADGVFRSQFWGRFWAWKDGKRVRETPDPVTGLYPFRDLDDAGMQEAIQNLTETYIANPQGAGTTRKEVARRQAFNEQVKRRQFLAAGEAFADIAAERGRRLRGATLVNIPVTVGTQGRKQ